MITIELTNEGAALFAEFRKRQDVFEAMERAKVFNIRDGNATLHFDRNGVLAKITRFDVGFKR